MQVNVETVGSLGRRMTVAVPADRLEREITDRLKRLSKTARFPGFRPGKAPFKMVEDRYGGTVMDEVAGDLIRSSFFEAVKEKGLNPAGGPRIEQSSISRGKDLTYVASFEIYPEISKTDLDGQRIERPMVSIDDEDVDRTLQKLREQRATWRSVERAAAVGDRVIIDFQGKVDGQPFQGGAATDFPLVLGNNVLIAGFESGLVGAGATEARTLDVTFPEDYRDSALAGKPAQFDVTVKQVNERVVPELNDDLARSLGVPDGSIDTLKKEVRANLERECDDRIRRVVRDRVFRSVADINDFDVPRALEQGEIQRMVQATRANLQAQGISAEKLPLNPESFVEQARYRTKVGLILAEIARKKDLRADPDQVRQRVEAAAESYDDPAGFVAWHYSSPDRLADFESQVLESEVVAVLLASATVTDNPMKFQDLIDLEKGAN